MKILTLILVFLIKTITIGQGCSYLVNNANIQYEIVFLDGSYKFYVKHFNFYKEQIAYSGENIFNEYITINTDDGIIYKPVDLILYDKIDGYWTERVSAVLTAEEITSILTTDKLSIQLNGFQNTVFNNVPKPLLSNLQGGFTAQCRLE